MGWEPRTEKCESIQTDIFLVFFMWFLETILLMYWCLQLNQQKNKLLCVMMEFPTEMVPWRYNCRCCDCWRCWQRVLCVFECCQCAGLLINAAECSELSECPSLFTVKQTLQYALLLTCIDCSPVDSLSQTCMAHYLIHLQKLTFKERLMLQKVLKHDDCLLMWR